MSEAKKVLTIPESAQETVSQKANVIRESQYAIHKAKRDIQIAKGTIFNVIEEALPECRNEEYSYDPETMEVTIGDKDCESNLGEMLEKVFGGK